MRTVVGLILILVILIAGSKLADCWALLLAAIAAIVGLVRWLAAHHRSGASP
jgi:hypothetical protein